MQNPHSSHQRCDLDKALERTWPCWSAYLHRSRFLVREDQGSTACSYEVKLGAEYGGAFSCMHRLHSELRPILDCWRWSLKWLNVLLRDWLAIVAVGWWLCWAAYPNRSSTNISP